MAGLVRDNGVTGKVRTSPESSRFGSKRVSLSSREAWCLWCLSRREIGAKQAEILKELKQEKSWKSPVFMRVTGILLKTLRDSKKAGVSILRSHPRLRNRISPREVIAPGYRVRPAKYWTLLCLGKTMAVCKSRRLGTAIERGNYTMATETSVMERASDTLTISKLDAARMLGVSVRTVDRLIALKRLPIRRIGRRVLVPRTSLSALLRSDHPTKAA
jgi:excisionase family DNA binding protein